MEDSKILRDSYIDSRYPGRTPNSLAYNASVVVGLSLVITLSAKISVPFYPVPMTLQTLAVVLIGALFGPRIGVAAIAAYLTQGLLGLPVFTGTPPLSGGLAYIAGPTGGFLVGFLASAWLAGSLVTSRLGASTVGLTTVFLLAIAAAYVPGLLWLGTFVGFGKEVIQLGAAPFVLAEATKVAIAVALLSALKRSPAPSA